MFGDIDLKDEPVLEGVPIGSVWMAAHVADVIAGGPIGVRNSSHDEFLFGKRGASIDPRLSAFYPESFMEVDGSKPHAPPQIAKRAAGRPFKLVKLKNVFSPDQIGDLPRLSKDQLLSAVQQQVGHVDSIAEHQEGRPRFLQRSQIEQIEEALKRAQARSSHDGMHLPLSSGPEQPDNVFKHLQLTEDGRPSFPVEAGLPPEEMMRNLHVTQDGKPSAEDVQAALQQLKRVGITKDRPAMHAADGDHSSSLQPVQLAPVRVAEAGFHIDLSGLKVVKTALLVTGGFVSKIFGLGIVGFLAWQSMQANVVGSHQRAAAQRNSGASGRPAPTSQMRSKSD